MKLTRSAECALRSGRDEADREIRKMSFRHPFCHPVLNPAILSSHPLLARTLLIL
ncbi:MAG: hypothetical protein IIT37_05140 [Bacteroidales bacterium]|nr:hypothetical protein [Bacteroidales bacterium]